MNLLTVLIAISVTMSCLYYWLTASNTHLKVAYWDAVINGLLLVYINYQLAQAPGSEGAHIFQVISVWIFINGIRGLRRLKFEGQQAEETG